MCGAGIENRNGTEENPEINPYAYGQLILNKCQGNWIGKRLSFQ